MDAKVYELMNEQIQKELYSAYLYLDMANYYSAEGLEGFANWFYIQAQEERDHAFLFQTYLLNNGKRIKLLAIDAPEGSYTAFDQPLDATLAHEKLVTASIHNIYDAAVSVKDYRAAEFLNWFVKEQAEEEKNADDLIRKYELFCKDGKGLYMMDQELAARVYAAPTLVLD
ncbi:MAG: ferritin [Clostridiales bacterium]|nr:ferritin [Clostridiales bacterium]